MTNTVSYGYVTPTSGFTFECWFWRNAVPSTTAANFFTQYTQKQVTWTNGGEKGRQCWFGLNPTTGAIHLSAGSDGGTNSGSYTDASPSGYEADSQWHHIALTLDSATRRTFKIYLDGELYATAFTLASACVWGAGTMTFAGSFDKNQETGGSFAWDKRMAYIAVFDRELTLNRIFEHYTAGNAGTVYYGDDEVERLTRIYDWAGVPQNLRLNEPAVTELQGIQVANSNALTRAQETSEAAGGYVFADGQSAMKYHNKRHRYNRFVALTVSETDGSAPEVGMTFTTNSAFIFNDIRGERPFGSKVRLENEVSQFEHGRKVHSIDISVTDPDELFNAVHWILARYGSDRVRISGVQFHCTSSRTLRKLAYAQVEIGDVLVMEELTDPAPLHEMEFVIEGIGIEANFLLKTWMVSLELSPSDVVKVFEVCKSELGGTDYLAF